MGSQRVRHDRSRVHMHTWKHTQPMCLHLGLPFYYLVHVSHILFLMPFSCPPLFKCLVFHFIYCLLNFFAAPFSDCLTDEDIHTYLFSLLTITIFYIEWSVLIETLLSYSYLFLLYAIDALCTTSTHTENIYVVFYFYYQI